MSLWDWCSLLLGFFLGTFGGLHLRQIAILSYKPWRVSPFRTFTNLYIVLPVLLGIMGSIQYILDIYHFFFIKLFIWGGLLLLSIFQSLEILAVIHVYIDKKDMDRSLECQKKGLVLASLYSIPTFVISCLLALTLPVNGLVYIMALLFGYAGICIMYAWKMSCMGKFFSNKGIQMLVFSIPYIIALLGVWNIVYFLYYQ